MRRLAIGLLVGVLTLSTGIGLALYVKQRARAKRCAESSYFPAGVFGEHTRTAEMLGKYYAAQVEPTFTCLGEDVEVYRLLYIPAFESPTSIRVWREQDKYWMSIKQLNEDWMPADGHKGLKLSTTRPLTVTEWAQFKSLLNKSDFWSLVSRDIREPGLDGVFFTLEGKQPGRYHVVHRWWPDDENFFDACVYLLQISNLTWRQQ